MNVSGDRTGEHCDKFRMTLHLVNDFLLQWLTDDGDADEGTNEPLPGINQDEIKSFCF